MDGSYDKLGPWSDFYALGATIFYLLTRKEIPTWTEIFEDKSSDKHVALPMPGISEETKSLVVWFMNTDREKRPRSVAEILEKATGLLSDDEATKLIGKSGAESQSTDFSRKPRSYGKNDRQSKSGAEPQSKGSSSGCLDCLLDGLGRILGLLVLSFFLKFIVYKIIGPYIIEPYVEKQMQKEQLKREQLFKSQMQENFRLIFKFPKDSAENLK